MRKALVKIGSGLVLLFIITGICWGDDADKFNLNPGQKDVKHKNDVTTDVQGTGYYTEYTKVNTNNLSMLEYSHGSGSMDFAEILHDEQKTTYSGSTVRYIDYTKGSWTSTNVGAASIITYTRQYDNKQSSTNFTYGSGWYKSHPITYDSLLKDKNEAKSYQESASMHRQVEYAKALKGDIAVEINCTPSTATVTGKGTISMNIDDEVKGGTLHVGEFLGMPLKSVDTPKYKTLQGWKDAIIDIEGDYVGDFQIQKTMKLEISKSSITWGEDWLPCCSGGFFDIPSYNFDKEMSGQKGIFDCTCRNTSISTMKPKWNTSQAQFPTEEYRYVA